jgi:O-antigen/teichoic acid export membrane protein
MNRIAIKCLKESGLMSLNVSQANVHAAGEAQKFQTQMGHISRHSAVFFVGMIFRIGAGYLFKVYLARTLGPEPLGIFALGMTIIGFLGLFSGLGLPQAAVRFVAHYTASGKSEQLRQFLVSATGVILAANVALGFTVLGLGPWLAVHFYHTPALSQYLKLFAVIMMLGALTTFFGKVLQGYKAVARLTVITDFVGTPLTMLASVVLITRGAGLRGYIFAQVISAAVVLAFLLRLVGKLTPAAARRWKGQVSRPESQVLSFSATMLGMGLLNFLISHTDKVFIGYYRNARELGIYAVAAAVVAYIPIALQSVNQIFAPTIADLHTRGERQLLGRLYQTLTRWVLAFTLPLALVIMVFAKPLMRIFGAGFEAGWLVLIIGTIGQLVNCGVGSVGILLLMSGNERRLIKVQVAAAVATVALGLALVPRWGIVGAAVASAAANVLTNTWNLVQVRRLLGFLPYNRSFLRLLLSTAISAIVVLFSEAMLRGAVPAWTSIAVGLLLAYAAFLGVSLARGLDADDRLIGRAVWAKMKGYLPTIDVGA